MYTAQRRKFAIKYTLILPMKRGNGKANKNSTLETSNAQESHITCTKKEKTIDQIKRKRLLSFCCGKVAQLVEQPAHIRSVTGPSPVLAITIPYMESFFFALFTKNTLNYFRPSVILHRNIFEKRTEN